MRTRRRLATVLSSAVLVAALSACGTGSDSGSDTSTSTSASETTTSETAAETPSVGELLDTMRASANAATSAKLAGSLTQAGKPMTLELAGSRDGTNQSATVTLDGGTAQILTVDGKDYVKADRAFWESQGVGQVADMVGSKYLTSDQRFSGDYTLGALLDEMFASEFTAADSLNTTVEAVDLNGSPAYKLTQTEGTDSTELWVSADGQANLLRIQGIYDGGPLQLSFSDWNAVAPFTAPPADQVLSV
ncbi:MAG: hypothetical protein ACK5MT_17415 [Actinomycetales bacterium]